MAEARDWLVAIRRTFTKFSCKSVAVVNHIDLIHDVTLEEEEEEEVAPPAVTEKIACYKGERNLKRKGLLVANDVAAIKIQACFRGHLARRALRALRSLVKLQALVRGVCVRRQAKIAIHCMQAMVRLQVRVRARRLLRTSGEMELLQS
ncbi:uncharacterized protein A4U43_C04F23600 [Asparagus officinalis]|uniref:Uncharacterized protein n=2 Tax=Asparagus officinalis TaxID=4686 RepID=A0A5P1F509_ASPOF|nr:uncharacterized protein A4U43_C04F23600 [Asparagus officinalis]